VTIASCANCTEDAIGMLNGTPLCGRHLREVHEEWILQDDAQQEQEARRLGIEIPPEVLRDRDPARSPARSRVRPGCLAAHHPVPG
jgi:hypothetical protein